MWNELLYEPSLQERKINIHDLEVRELEFLSLAFMAGGPSH